MTVKRLYARLCIAAATIGAAIMLIGLLLTNVILVLVSAFFILIAFIIKFSLLKCPHCKWSGLMPQWDKSGTIHCVKCGKPIVYDDSK